MKRIFLELMLICAVSGCGTYDDHDIYCCDDCRRLQCKQYQADLDRAAKRTMIDRAKGEWMGYGVPSALVGMIDKASPLNEDEAIQYAYDIALIMVGSDHLLSLSSLSITSEVSHGSASAGQMDENGKEIWSTFTCTSHTAKVALENKSPLRPWNMAVEFMGGTIYSYNCTPPVFTNYAEQGICFSPSYYRRAWQNPTDSNQAARIGMQVTQLLDGIWPTQEAVASFDEAHKEWHVEVKEREGYGDRFRVVRISTEGHILSFENGRDGLFTE